MSTVWRVTVTFNCGHRRDRYVSLRPGYSTEVRAPWPCDDCSDQQRALRNMRGVELIALERVRQSPEFKERRISDEQ